MEIHKGSGKGLWVVGAEKRKKENGIKDPKCQGHAGGRAGVRCDEFRLNLIDLNGRVDCPHKPIRGKVPNCTWEEKIKRGWLDKFSKTHLLK